MNTVLARHLAAVWERIAAACRRAGRQENEVRLLAVSKTQTSQAIRELALAGQVLFGENRVQEATEKIPCLADLPLAWHLIGHLQGNKVKTAVTLFHCIESVDSLALAEEISRRLPPERKVMPVYLQVNVGREPQKSGFDPDAVLEAHAAVAALPRLRVEGVMAIPPVALDANEARPYFRQLRRLADRLPVSGPVEVSMGMSHDFEVAIEEGATLVRVGSALFGGRV